MTPQVLSAVENRTKGPLPRAEFHICWGRNVGIQPPKLSNFGYKFALRVTRLHNSYEILRFCTCI